MIYEEAITCIKENICYEQEACADGICKSTEARPCAIDVAIEALEKQTPKKPFLMFCDSDNTEYICDECGCALTGCVDTPSHCPWCGQAIDWRKAE